MAFFAASPAASCRIASQVACGEVPAKPRQAFSGKSNIEEMHEETPGAAVRAGVSCTREARLSCVEGVSEGRGCMYAKTDDGTLLEQKQHLQERRRKGRPGAPDDVAATFKGGSVAGGQGTTSTDILASSAGKNPSGRTMVSAATERKYASNSVREQRMFYGAFILLGSTIALSQVVALPVLLQMLCYTAPILYIGSHASLRQNEVDACTGERTTRTESMNHTDALLFPVFGSIALVTLYVAYKFMNASWVNFLLTLYLTAIGFFALGETIYMALSVLIREVPADSSSLNSKTTTAPATYVDVPAEMFVQHPFLPAWVNDERRVVFRIPLPHIPLLFSTTTEGTTTAAEGKTATNSGSFTYTRSYAQLLSYGIAAALSFIWLWTKHWVVHNLLAIAFCIQAIGIVSVGNFTVAAILLSGLFVYDIFWVFGTDVMITVAKRFNKFYFWVVLVFYECGLITTGVVMLLFQHPQPALLYLVPFCLFSFFGAAALNGQVKEVLAYSEEEESAGAGAGGAVPGASGIEADEAAASINAAGDEDDEEEEEEEAEKRKKN